MTDIDQIFILNYAPLTERLKNISTTMSYFGESFRVIQDEPPVEWISSLPQDKEKWDEKITYINYPEFRSHRSLSKEELSIAYKQLRAFEIISEEKIRTALILEDDVLFKNNFIHLFDMYFQKDLEYDFLFIGNGCGLRIDEKLIVPEKHCYLKSHPASKCADSFIVTNSAVNRILSTIHPVSLPWDIELCYQMKLHNMRVYWLEPPITVQGSQSGLGGEYASAIQIHEN